MPGRFGRPPEQDIGLSKPSREEKSLINSSSDPNLAGSLQTLLGLISNDALMGSA